MPQSGTTWHSPGPWAGPGDLQRSLPTLVNPWSSHGLPFPGPGALSLLAFAVSLTPTIAWGSLLPNSNIWFLVKVPGPTHLTTAGPHSYSRTCSRCSIYANIPFERFPFIFFSLQWTAFPCHIANWRPDDHTSLNSTQQNFSSIFMVDSADACDLNTLCDLLASVQDNEHFRI